jgi:hypothetical protein
LQRTTPLPTKVARIAPEEEIPATGIEHGTRVDCVNTDQSSVK